MLKKYLGVLACFICLGLSPLHAQENFSNYKNYELTKTKFKLEKVTDGLNHPWGLTFIDDKHLIVTEKNGGLKKNKY